MKVNLLVILEYILSIKVYLKIVNKKLVCFKNVFYIYQVFFVFLCICIYVFLYFVFLCIVYICYVSLCYI